MAACVFYLHLGNSGSLSSSVMFIILKYILLFDDKILLYSNTIVTEITTSGATDTVLFQSHVCDNIHCC